MSTNPSANTLVVLDQGRPPSIFQAASYLPINAAAQANISLGFPVVTYRGKVWRLVYQGDEEVVSDPMRPEVPAASLNVVIIGVAEAVSKQYYAKPYVDGSDAAPDCYSLDGVKPEANAPQKQNPLCASCPQNQWGSRITDDGRRAKRCQDAKRLAIVPSGDIENEAFGGPMLLRVPPTSLPNLSMYAGMLARRSAPLMAVETRIGFNVELAYPQLTFTPTRWLNDEEARLVVGPDGTSGMVAHPLVGRILFDSIAQGAPGAGETEPAPAPDQPAQQPEPAPAPVQEPQPPPPSQQPPPQAAQPAPQAAPQAAPARRAAAFGGGGAPAQPASIMTQPQPPAQPAPAQAAPNGAAGQVTTAPANMQQAIDQLLASPIA